MQPTETDLAFMRRCIELSALSLQQGDGPFGSLITRNNQLLIEGKNGYRNRISDHAEVLVLHEAHQLLGTSNLSDCTLYTSCEPCPMCSFMIREYKIQKVFFALRSPYMGGFTKWAILQDEALATLRPVFDAPPQVIGGVLEHEAWEVMRQSPLWMFGPGAAQAKHKN